MPKNAYFATFANLRQECLNGLRRVNYSGNAYIFALFSEKNTTPGKNSTTAGRDKSHVCFYKAKVFAQINDAKIILHPNILQCPL